MAGLDEVLEAGAGVVGEAGVEEAVEALAGVGGLVGDEGEVGHGVKMKRVRGKQAGNARWGGGECPIKKEAWKGEMGGSFDGAGGAFVFKPERA